MNLQEKVQHLTSNGYEFKFGHYLSKGWELFGKKPGHFIGFFVLTMLMSIVVAFIPLIGSIAAQILGAILMVGYYVFCQNIKLSTSPSFDDLFKGFSSFGRIAIIQLILLAFIIVIMLPLFIYGFSVFFSGIFSAIKDPMYYDPTPAEVFQMFDFQALIPLMVITYLFLIFIQIIYMFAAPVAHFYQASAWQSMEASRKVIQKRFFHFFGLIIVLGLINILGVLCLFVGLLVTIPLTYTTMYAAFDDIFNPDENSGIEVPDESFEDRAH